MGLLDRFSRKAADGDTAKDASSEDSADTTSATPSGDAGTPKKKGFFSRFRQGLEKTSAVLRTDIRDIFKQEGQLVDDDLLERLFAILVRTDMGAGPAGEIRDTIQSEFRGRVVQMNEILATVKQRLAELMSQGEAPIELAANGPTVIVVVGVNGSGKTTSIAKLANMFVAQGKSVVLGAGDTFRAAAVQQLTIWSERIGTEIVKGEPNSDPASVAHRVVSHALNNDTDVCIVDTAGRLQTQSNLMDELAKIRRVIEKQIPDAPHEVLLVLDATAGQNGVSQAKGFSDAVQCTGIVLAKLDGSAKGGVVVPIRRQFELPVRYIGVGESADDFALFNATDFVDAMFADAAA